MPNNPNRLSKFWGELKRRNVTRVLAVYIAAAFMILELVDIVSGPFGLPDWSLKMAFFILFAGLFITVIISWIYDIHPKQGIVKTKPVETIKPGDKPVSSSRWRIATYVSFVMIIGLVVLNVLGRGKQLRAGDIQRILILPLANYTGADSLDFFVEGMHSSLISDVGRISGLEVINKTTSNVYKNVNMPIHEIASALNVDAVIEGDIMCLGDSFCTQLRMIHGSSEEKLLWIEDYIEETSQILNFYKRITKQIAGEVKVELTPEEERLLAKSSVVDREAYKAYLRGNTYAEDLSHESLIKARNYLNSAIEKDPSWAPLYGAMATVWLSIGSMGVESPEIAVPIVYEYLNKALELDPDLADAHYVSAFMAFAAEWDWEKAEKEFMKALAVNPNHVFSRIHYSHMLYILQRPEEGLAQAKRAINLDPLNPLIQSTYALTLLCERDCASALSVVEKTLASDPDNFLANNVVDAAAFQCGDLDRVFEAEMQKQPLEEDLMDEVEKIYNRDGFHAAYEEIMHQLELQAKKTYVTPADMAFKYYMINQDDKALDWIERGTEVHDPSTLYIGTGYFNYTRLYDNPRFIKVFEKLNLPLPSSI